MHACSHVPVLLFEALCPRSAYVTTCCFVRKAVSGSRRRRRAGVAYGIMLIAVLYRGLSL